MAAGKAKEKKQFWFLVKLKKQKKQFWFLVEQKKQFLVFGFWSRVKIRKAKERGFEFDANLN